MKKNITYTNIYSDKLYSCQKITLVGLITLPKKEKIYIEGPCQTPLPPMLRGLVNFKKYAEGES